MLLSPFVFIFLFFSLSEVHAVAIQWGIYGDAQDFQYKEFLDGEVIDREDGWLYGVGGNVRFDFPGNFVLRANPEFDVGQVEYNGRTQRIDPDGQVRTGGSLSTDTNEYIFRTDVQGHYKFSPADTVQILPFGGVGGRIWYRSIQSTGNVSGINERYSIYYYSAGLMTDLILKQGYTVELEGGIRYPFYSVIWIDDFGERTLDLGKRMSNYAEIKFSFPIDSTVDFMVAGFYENWKIGRSESEVILRTSTTVFSIFEPRSDTKQWGIRAGVQF
jgi:hypothetical protein